MKSSILLTDLLTRGDKPHRLGLFALIALGVVDSLQTGAISTDQAIRAFFNAENCQFVRTSLKSPPADRIMSHGVQLGDLFETLPADEAQQQFQRELASIRTLCQKLVSVYRAAA